MAKGLLIGGSMLLLAGLDMAGALLAQKYAEGGRPYALVLGAATFVVLFVVYAAALRWAQLSVVTMGWIVLLQVGLVAIDVARRNVTLDARQWAAVAAVLLLQCYLVTSTQADDEPVAVPEQRRPVEAVLAGPTCESVDAPYRSASAPPLDLVPGDRVRLHATGAYTATDASVGLNGLAPLAVRVQGHRDGGVEVRTSRAPTA